MNEKAKQLRNEAAAHRAKAEESFERSDTDGFLSQWANTITAQKKEVQADIEENGGKAQFAALFDGDRRVDAKKCHTRYGPKWRLSDEETERFGRRWIPIDDSHLDPAEIDGHLRRSHVQIALGLHQELEWAPARAYIAGSGTGLSGAANAYVAIKRIDARVKRTDGK